MWALTAATYIGACKFMRLLLAVKRRFSTTIPLHGRWHAPHEYYILCMCVCVCRTQWQPHTKPIWRVHKIRAVLCLCKPLTISCDVHTHDTYRPKSRAPGLMPVIKARACMKTHIIVLSPTSAHTHCSHDRFIICLWKWLDHFTAPLQLSNVCAGLGARIEHIAGVLSIFNIQTASGERNGMQKKRPEVTVHDCTLIRSMSCAERANMNCTKLRMYTQRYSQN